MSAIHVKTTDLLPGDVLAVSGLEVVAIGPASRHNMVKVSILKFGKVTTNMWHRDWTSPVYRKV